MQKLLKQYLQEQNIHNEDMYHVKSWDRPSQMVCCKRGIYVFLEANSNRQIMYKELCKVLGGV